MMKVYLRSILSWIPKPLDTPARGKTTVGVGGACTPDCATETAF